MSIKTKEDIVSRIIDFEIETGKRIVDVFMRDTIDDGAWAYWLLSKGYVKHANNILMLLLEDDKKLNENLYEVYDENDEDVHLLEENIIKNIELISEFLVETPSYLNKLNIFFENYK